MFLKIKKQSPFLTAFVFKIMPVMIFAGSNEPLASTAAHTKKRGHACPPLKSIWHCGLIAIIYFLSSSGQAQTTSIPDPNFEQALIYLNLDTGPTDGLVLTANISSITSLDVSSKNINDLTGIQYFSNLESLNCSLNQLSTLNVSALANLRYLDCGSNGLTSINVSGLSHLSSLDCRGFNDGESTSLNTVGLSSLNLTGLTSLNTLNCAYNLLTSLDLRDAVELQYLDCRLNQISSLDISGLYLLDTINCGLNELTTLDLSSCPSLSTLTCNHNNLSSLDVTAQSYLSSLTCNNNGINSIDLSNNIFLKYLNCSHNILETLNLSGLSLEYIDCSYNGITMLDFANFGALTTLYCNNNIINQLNLAGCDELSALEANHNQLSSLNLYNLNTITYLNVLDNPDLTCIAVSNPAGVMANSISNYYKDSNANYHLNTCEAVTLIPDPSFEARLVYWNYDDAIDGQVVTAHISNITSLDISESDIEDLTGIQDFVSLESLQCEESRLTSLDVTALSHLKSLKCNDNNLTTLFVSGLSNLETLTCGNNELTQLNLTGLTHLKDLNSHNNNLTSLDVSASTNLQNLSCSSNKLSTLNLISLNNLSMLDAVDNPDLSCIAVSNPATAAVNSNFHEDITANYVSSPCLMTKVQASQCGTILAATNTTISANAVPGATNYRFECTNENTVRTLDGSGTARTFKLSNFSGGAYYNTTYFVRAQAKVGGVWQGYGDTCELTTPAFSPVTQIRAIHCGSTLAALATKVYADPVAGIEGYRFQITDSSNGVRLYDSTASYFDLSTIPGSLYSTAYCVKVATKVAGTYGAYGSACTITTPAAITHVRATQCGTTLALLNAAIYADALLYAECYEFEVTTVSTAVVRSYLTPNPNFKLTNLTGSAAYNTAYSIRVRVKTNGSWAPWGSACEVSTPALSARPVIASSEAIEKNAVAISVYPNPYIDTFNILVDSKSQPELYVSIFDMNGRQVISKTVKAADMPSTGFGDGLASGVYNVIISQGEDISSLRVIRK